MKLIFFSKSVKFYLDLENAIEIQENIFGF